MIRIVDRRLGIEDVRNQLNSYHEASPSEKNKPVNKYTYDINPE
jgi:hypothetical protein